MKRRGDEGKGGEMREVMLRGRHKRQTEKIIKSK